VFQSQYKRNQIKFPSKCIIILPLLPVSFSLVVAGHVSIADDVIVDGRRWVALASWRLFRLNMRKKSNVDDDDEVIGVGDAILALIFLYFVERDAKELNI